MCMAPREAVEQLPSVALHLLGRELVAIVACTLQIGVTELESEIKGSVGVEHVLQLDDVLVLHLAQDRYLT